MRRTGALLMIIGANLFAGSIALGVYFATVACLMAGTGCTSGLLQSYGELMTSAQGILFWIAIVAGVVLFVRGKRMRAETGRE